MKNKKSVWEQGCCGSIKVVELEQKSLKLSVHAWTQHIKLRELCFPSYDVMLCLSLIIFLLTSFKNESINNNQFQFKFKFEGY